MSNITPLRDDLAEPHESLDLGVYRTVWDQFRSPNPHLLTARDAAVLLAAMGLGSGRRVHATRAIQRRWDALTDAAVALLDQDAASLVTESDQSRGSVEGLQIFELLRKWTRFLEASGLATRTVEGYRGNVVRFLARTLRNPLELREEDIVEHLMEMAPQGPNRDQMLRGLRSFYQWAARRGLIETDPSAAIAFRKPRYPHPVALSEDEVRRVLVAAAWHAEKRAWTIALMLETGCRIGSLAGLMPEDVPTEPGRPVRFNVAKGDRPYSVPLSELGAIAARRLHELRAHPHRHDSRRAEERLPTFIGVRVNRIREWYQVAARDAGLERRKQRPHILRDTFATNLLRRGVDVRTVQSLMNHADLSQLHRYIAVTDKRRRDAVRGWSFEGLDDTDA